MTQHANNAAAATQTEENNNVAMKIATSLLGNIPLFGYYFLIYVIFQATVPDIRSVFFSMGTYSLSYVEVLQMIAATVAMTELLRVSKPGVDNTFQAIMMAGAMVVFIVLFALGASNNWAMFNNTEFLFIVYISLVQVVMAFIINARTLKRTLDMQS